MRDPRGLVAYAGVRKDGHIRNDEFDGSYRVCTNGNITFQVNATPIFRDLGLQTSSFNCGSIPCLPYYSLLASVRHRHQPSCPRGKMAQSLVRSLRRIFRFEQTNDDIGSADSTAASAQPVEMHARMICPRFSVFHYGGKESTDRPEPDDAIPVSPHSNNGSESGESIPYVRKGCHAHIVMPRRSPPICTWRVTPQSVS